MMRLTRRFGQAFAAVLLAGVLTAVAVGGEGGEPRAVKFAKHVIANEPAISATALDVDGDGLLDVVSAGGQHGGHSKWAHLIYWHRAPKWERKLVGRLKQDAIILHTEAVDFTSRGPVKDRLKRRPEITVADGLRGEVWWFRYDRAARKWSGSILVSGFPGVHGTAAGDIDGDGYADLLVPTQRGRPKKGIVWLKNPGKTGEREEPWTGRYALADAFEITGGQHYVRLVDINADGKLDVLHGSSDRKHGWFGFWLQGRSPFSPWTARAMSGPMKRATNLDAADLNGDGRVDLVGTEGHGVGVWWFPAPDYQPRRVDNTLKSAHCLALGDFNRDGATDIVSCGYASKKVACFLNRGNGVFRPLVIDQDQCAYDASAVDLDKDGDLDILLAGMKSYNVVWYENLGTD